MSKAFHYGRLPREDLLQAVPADGSVIGSIGCSNGATEAVLVRAGREVHGVDLDPDAIEVAKERLTSARVVQPGDLTPFDENQLDGLILGDVIEHIPCAWSALASFTRMVRPGGWVLISVPNMRYYPALAHFLLRGEWAEAELGIFDKTHLQVVTKRRLIRWCRFAGLEIEKWHDKYHFLRPRRDPLLDKWTFGLLHEFFMYQFVVVCRRRGEPNPSALNLKTI
jgi:2-polyprenyl-3-methyl-5-hydroxy-6-metoxy-1,4-benzoquinol methylase